MKKIKITVAALLLGGMSYAQCTSKTDLFCSCDSLTIEQISNIAYIESVNTIEDMVEWMRWDIKTGAVEPEVGQSYVESLMSLLSKLEDINAGIIEQR
jgi:hypothetical protein